MKIIDVKEIHHIPNIEDFLEEEFTLSIYDVGDKTQVYDVVVDGQEYEVEIISDTRLIHPTDNLCDMITQENIHYFQWSLIERYSDKIVEAYTYRPLIAEENKNYG